MSLHFGGGGTSTAVETIPLEDVELEIHPYQGPDHITRTVHGTSHPNASTTTRNTYPRDSPATQLTPAASPETQTPTKKLPGTAIAVLMTPLCLCHFLSALDFTIITPATPSIVHSFSSATSYVWIGSAFILSSTAITPVWGSVADIWGRKAILLIALLVFLAGSLICALAPQMKVLVAGRAVQGLGSSGMGTMVNVVICDSFSLRERGLWFAVTSGVWAVGSAVAPVIGGAFTKGLGWRWCFWINLPIGAVVFFVLLFSLKVPSPKTPIMTGLKAIDWTGSLLIIGAALMILLGLDFGDVAFPWSSTTVISLIIAGVVTLALFVGNEWKLASNPVIPLRLFSNRSTVAAYVIWACNFSVLVGLSYYLPLYSQSVFGADALTSGVHLIPLVVSCSLAAVGVGAFIQKTGVYLPITYIAHALLVLGTGLLINLKPGEGISKMLVCEIIIGTGVGMNLDPPLLAVQASLTVLDTAAIQATMTFLRSLATTVTIVVGGVIFQNRMNVASRDMADQLGKKVAGMFSGDYAAASVEVLRSLPVEQREVVRGAYFVALKSVWIMLVVIAGVSSVTNVFLRAHHLDDESQAAILGVDRAKHSEPQPQGLRRTQSIQSHQYDDRTVPHLASVN